jgi:hypothetical protein
MDQIPPSMVQTIDGLNEQFRASGEESGNAFMTALLTKFSTKTIA